MIYREEDFKLQFLQDIIPKSMYATGERGFSYYSGNRLEDILRATSLFLCIDKKIDISAIGEFSKDLNLILCDNPMLFFVRTCRFLYSNLSYKKRYIHYNNFVYYDKVDFGLFTDIGSYCVIGDDGFGFAFDGKQYVQMPHFGGVRIGDGASIGPLTVIDAGIFEDTVIGNDVMIDNMCQIAHNVRIGDRTRIMAKVSISGGVTIGKDCWIAPGSIIKNGITIGDNCMIGIGSVVTIDVPSGKTYKPKYKELYVIE
jgi:acetyltransferase-like isoleucine patch superfamily enzyme